MEKSDSFMSVGINMVLLRCCNFIEEVSVDVSRSLSFVLTGQGKTSHRGICESSSDVVDKCHCYNASVTVLFFG